LQFPDSSASLDLGHHLGFGREARDRGHRWAALIHRHSAAKTAEDSRMQRS
jgi:hypothetical protein